MTWSELQRVFDANTSFLISSHTNPDGDCIGAQLALLWYLENSGKSVRVYDVDPVPSKLSFLTGASRISAAKPAGQFDVLVSLDASNLDRLGWEGAEGIASHIVNIDHHRDNKAFAHLNIVDHTLSATGEIIYQFFRDTAVDYPPHVATSLYTAIMTDTGGFRFSNTNGSVLRACADLADRGAECAEAYRNLYASDTPAGLLLKARIWSTLAFHFDNRVCTLELPLNLYKELGAEYGDSEGMADHTISSIGVQVGMLIKHNATETHFSLRSMGSIDVGAIARSIKGGGGHANAAGCTLPLPLREAKEKMLGIISKELR
jgi:bifunctional oligoribonuclease and PAP phosphatase NrnA